MRSDDRDDNDGLLSAGGISGMGSDAGRGVIVEGAGSGSPDVRVSRFEGPESLYDVAWGAADAWVFVSVSYNGVVVLNHVPSKEKYKILL